MARCATEARRPDEGGQGERDERVAPEHATRDDDRRRRRSDGCHRDRRRPILEWRRSRPHEDETSDDEDAKGVGTPPVPREVPEALSLEQFRSEDRLVAVVQDGTHERRNDDWQQREADERGAQSPTAADRGTEEQRADDWLGNVGGDGPDEPRNGPVVHQTETHRGGREGEQPQRPRAPRRQHEHREREARRRVERSASGRAEEPERHLREKPVGDGERDGKERQPGPHRSAVAVETRSHGPAADAHDIHRGIGGGSRRVVEQPALLVTSGHLVPTTGVPATSSA
jgi:hypothetical protein